MYDPNSNVDENDNKISLSEIKSEAERFFSQKPKKRKPSHQDIFDEVRTKLEPVDFNVLAGISNIHKLSQKHEIVLCVDEFLRAIRDLGFDFATKDGFVFLYNGEYWSEIDCESLKKFLSGAAEIVGINALEARHYEFAEKLLKQFFTVAHFEGSEPGVEKVHINLRNGTFEIDRDNQELREFRASDFLTYQLQFEYDPTAKSPMFQTYLDEVLPEKELQDVVAEFFAYTFVKCLKLEIAAFFYGPGANGKSVLFDVVRELYGRENISHFSLSDLMVENNRALINNKLLNYGSEINASKTRDIFQNLASNEPIQARLKYRDSFMMKDYARLCFNANELPRDINQTDSYFRRLLIVPFRVRIPEDKQDKELAQKIIKNELPGVFNWILNGLHRLLENKKFTTSKIIDNEKKIYRADSDSIALFLDECKLVRHAKKTLLLKNIYAAYREFCHTDGYKPLNKKNFSKRLQTVHGYLFERQNTGINIYCEYSQSAGDGTSAASGF